MNNDRRRRLDFCNLSLSCIDSELMELKESMLNLSNLKKDIDRLSAKVGEIEKRLDGIYDEEWEAYGSLPENLQSTDIAFDMWNAIESMQSAQKQFSTLYNKLDELESIYLSNFMASYNPTEVIAQIDNLCEAITACKEDIEEAK